MIDICSFEGKKKESCEGIESGRTFSCQAKLSCVSYFGATPIEPFGKPKKLLFVINFFVLSETQMSGSDYCLNDE